VNRFAGQVAVVTGATGGIGRAIAARLVACGATAALVGRCTQALDALVFDSAHGGASVTRWPADLGVESDVQTLAAGIGEAYPQVHILVHAAGTIGFGPIDDSPAAELDAQYRVNVRAPYQLTRALLPRMLACGGQVIFINSSAGTGGRAGLSQYVATKHALRGLADSLRDEVNDRGMRVTSVFLGRTATGMQALVHRREGREYHPDRLIQPDDVASVVVGALLLPRTAEVTDIHVRPMLKP